MAIGVFGILAVAVLVPHRLSLEDAQPCQIFADRDQPTRRENPVRQDGYRLFEVDSPVRKMDRHHADCN